MPPAGGSHGRIAAGILARIWWHVTQNQLGDVYTSETGFILARDPDVVLAPDAAFIRAERVPEDKPGFFEIAPDLVVEVVSPNDSASYVQRKVMEFLDGGVHLVWIVDPEGKTITVYDDAGAVRFLSVADDLDGGDVLPEFSVAVATLFE